VLPGRGLVQIGLSTGEAASASTRCVAEAETSFGPQAPALRPGELGHVSTPLFAGMEGSARVLVLAAIDTSDEETRPRDLSLVVEPITALGRAYDVSARRFLAYPEGKLDRGAATFELTRTSSATGTRLVVESPRGTWIVHAPAPMTTIALPDVAAARRILAESTSGVVQSFELTGTFADHWRLDAGPTVERTIGRLRAVATTQCFRPGPCTVE
jgi:hypothetical protein